MNAPAAFPASDKLQPTFVQLNDHMACNWTFAARPIAVLNLDSSIHERVAYCWGLAANLDALAELGASSGDVDVSNFSNLVSSMLVPLLATLGNLGTVTFQAEKCGAP